MSASKKPTTWLLDGNVLVAICVRTHPHHQRAFGWFDKLTAPFATCAVTQGTLLRLHMQTSGSASARAAWAALAEFVQQADHVFWEDGFSYLDVAHEGLTGHRQITDAWLAALARRHGARVATMDGGFAALYPDVVSLLPEKPASLSFR